MENRGDPTVLEEMSGRMTGTPKILIIDDSVTSCLLMEQQLRKHGYQVTVATNGREGLNIALKELPHCLILDVVLPGMSGFEVCRQLRSMNMLHSMAVIMVSSKNTPLDKSWAFRQGATQYLVKPFKEETFINTVKAVLSRTTAPMAAIRPSQVKHTPNLTTQPVLPQPLPNTLPYSAPTQPSVPRDTATQERLHAYRNAEPMPLNNRGPQPLSTNQSRIPQQETNTSMGAINPLPVHSQPTAEQRPVSASLPIAKLVPQRVEGQGISQPQAAQMLATLDKSIRVLYEAIDGYRRVEDLRAITQLTMEEVTRALRYLLIRRLVRLHDTHGNMVNSSLYFSNFLQ